jgi:UDP-glucuronate 4-epimerase
MIKLIEEALGREAKNRLLPAQPGDVGSTWAEFVELTRETGFSTSTSLSVGIRQLVDWYRDY